MGDHLKFNYVNFILGSQLSSEGKICKLFVEGYITDDEFIKWVNDNPYKPYIEKIIFDSLAHDIHDKVRREIMAENKEELVSLDLDFFS